MLSTFHLNVHSGIHRLKKLEPVSYPNHDKQQHRKVLLIDLYKNSNTIGFLDRVRCTSLKNRLKILNDVCCNA